MPQPPAVVDSSEPLLEVYRRAQARLEREMARILADPRARRQRRRIRSILRQVDEEIEAIEAATRRWLQTTLPAVYEAGATEVGLGVDWSAIHRTAMQALAEDAFVDILTANRGMRDDARRWVRETSRWMSSKTYVEGLNPVTVARQFAEQARSRVAASGIPAPIGAVQYADGSVRSIDTYAEMLFRTKTAQTFNAGTINAGLVAGAETFEIVDGIDCGLRTHEDPEKANGRIVTAQAAAAYPISHPNCRRSFIPRYDIGTDAADTFSVDGPTPSEIVSDEFGLQSQPFQRARQQTRSQRQPRQARQQPAQVQARNRISGDPLADSDELAAMGVPRDWQDTDSWYLKNQDRGDTTAARIFDSQGFNAPPRVVSAGEMDDLVEQGWTRLHRGVKGGSHGSDERTAAEIAEAFRTGELYVGGGIFGSGTYTSPNRAFASSYGDEVLDVALSPTAKTVTTEEIRDLYAELENGSWAFTFGTPDGEERYNAINHLKSVYSDDGKFAAALGYDAVIAKGGEEVLILNRAAVAVKA